MSRRTLLWVLAAVLLTAAPASPAGAHEVAPDPWAAFQSRLAPAATAAEPPATPAPRARCGPRSRPEPGIQGRVPKDDVDAGRADEGYWCNLTRIGHAGDTGGFRVHRYVD